MKGHARLGAPCLDGDDGYMDVAICKKPSCWILKNACTLLHVLHLNKISGENDDALCLLI